MITRSSFRAGRAIAVVRVEGPDYRSDGGSSASAPNDRVRWWLARIALGTVALGATACGGAEPTPAWHEEQGYRWREITVASSAAGPGFTTLDGRATGIRFANTVSDSALLRNRVLAQGAGIALGDVDGDGLVDVFLARTEGCNALYRNRGAWKFEDVTVAAGVGACDRFSTGAAFADLEGDGDLDLVQLATRGPNAIFVNDGAGRFNERRDLGLDATGKGGTTIALADVDGNGTLDMFVANYKPYIIDDSLPPQQRAFNQMIRQTGPAQFEVVKEHRGEYKIVMRPDMGGLRMTVRASPDDFYLNEGGKLRRVSMASDRFRDASGQPLAEEPESFTLGARFADLDGDRSPDLYLANDFEDTDQLWFNDGKGSFRLADWTAQRQISNSAMGVDVADVNGDGRPDLFEVDMLSKDSRRLKTQIPTHTAFPKRPGDLETQLQHQRNALFINRGDRTFAEASYLAGVQASGWSWSTMFMDVDLDGWQDILITNGHLWDLMDADVQEGLQNRLRDVPWQRFRWQFPELKLKNVAYRNRGDLKFEDASAQWRFGVEDDISHTIAGGDLDGDGDVDAIVGRLGAPALVLRNDAQAPRVAVRLVGAAPNTRAVGARIQLLGGAVPLQQHEVVAGGLYMSHSDYQAAFAMGASDTATLIVDWRDGRRTTISGVRPNRLYEINQSAAGAATVPTTFTASTGSALFEDVTSQLGGHAHADPPFDDWERQFLLPNSLAHLGPGVAWFDYDRDGDEDLLIGSGRGGRLGVFRNDRGRLTPRPNDGFVAVADLTTVLGLASAAGTRIVAGVSSWEGQPVPAAVSVPASDGGIGGTASALVPDGGAATGPLATADYDGDGDLDLFVGGRAVPAKYPDPAASRLFINDAGRYVADTTNNSALQSAGLVSAASFADIDADGDADLLLAREWSSILVLVNDRGRYSPAPASLGLDRWTSRWNGLATGDLDGDGRLDIVATSWGRNTMLGADSLNPLVVFSGTFAPQGAKEMLIARNDARIGALAPLNSYPRVREVVPDLPKRLGTFAAYANASVDQVVGVHKSALVQRSIVTLDHMVFLNRGDRFDARPLPVEAQLAPAFYAGVADFNGDGFEDVFLSQNFFATAVGIPRFDAGRGLVMLGDGKGGLAALDGTKSGVLVYGDQRGAAYADFDGDARLDLVVSQNAATTRVLRNRGAAPGIRVRLRGPAANPDGIGAQLRLLYADRSGPVREVQAGSGYWSQNGSVQVLAARGSPNAVSVRWPDGSVTRTAIPPQARDVTAQFVYPGPR